MGRRNNNNTKKKSCQPFWNRRPFSFWCFNVCFVSLNRSVSSSVVLFIAVKRTFWPDFLSPDRPAISQLSWKVWCFGSPYHSATTVTYQSMTLDMWIIERRGSSRWDRIYDICDHMRRRRGGQKADGRKDDGAKLKFLAKFSPFFVTCTYADISLQFFFQEDTARRE